MAAPTPSARGIPDGVRLKDGFRSVVTFELNPTIAIFEREVTPPGIDGREPIDTMTMHTNRWMTKHPRQLLEMTNGSISFAYDPKVYDDILDLINQVTVVTHTFSNGDRLSYWGFLKAFKPESHGEGKMPMASGELIPTNEDPNTNTEEDPVFTPGPGGTGTGTGN